MKKEDLDRIRAEVQGDFFYYESVGSTNAEALKYANAEDKSLFLTQNQTAGRGRMGRSWENSCGGVYMTVLLKPEGISENISSLTLASGLAAARVIPNSTIKWPNDIILGDKKVAGILAETRVSGKNAVIAVGIGINVNNPEFSGDLAEKATSMYLYSGETQDITEIVIRFYTEFLKIYEDFKKSGFSKIKKEYEEKCVTLNREIVVLIGGKERIMTVKGINEKGELIAIADGKTEIINFGEVSVRGLLGYA
ncbi:MAG: biotin--[acetyl-CoA-carboxylase] ligase [Firmicutes bacterium]|nr:biotin--[acetyl-CoA-carboxylase] ligase [Bacillota bacterium]